MDFSYLKNQIALPFFFIGSLIFTLSCQPDLDYTIHGYTQKIIVEGTIETGKHPVVYLSLNVPLWKNLDSITVLEHVIRYAKVTIDDGSNVEILTSKWDKTHFPPYSYNATDMLGEEGKTYYLKVDYSGHTVYATTFLPYGTGVENAECAPSSLSDTLKILSVWLDINITQKTGFRIFTKKQRDSRYIETPLVFNENIQLSGLQKFNLSPASEKTDSSFREGKYFAVGDTIDIKVCALDSVSTFFFKDLSMYSTIAGNIFTSEVKPLKSNISEPGFGIWYGSAVRHYRYVVK